MVTQPRITDQALTDQGLAHRLLVELLSYQFASPVQWIETQAEILKHSDSAQRIVEIGPQAILSGLAKRATKRKFPTHSTLRTPQIEILSSATNQDSIYYEYEEEPEPEVEAEEQSQTKDAPAPAPVAAAPAPAPVSQAVDIPDVPLPAADVLLAILARKLNQPFEAISLQSSIKQLSAGKSTIQNEIIGDLHGEFSRVPDDPEGTSIEGMATAIDSSFNHSLGSVTSKLLAKIMSAKMPAGFNQAAIADHLSSWWGLKKGRQASVFCIALTSEPPARLTAVDQAKEWLDGIVKRYSSFAKVSLTPNAGAAAQAAAPQMAAQSGGAGSEGGSAKLHEYLKKHSDMISKVLGDQSTPILDNSEAAEVQELLESQLLRWSEEFDDTFADGLKPKFEAERIRKYDSSWNWVRQELISTFQDPSRSDLPSLPDEWIRLILPRWDQNCQKLVDFYASRSKVPEKWQKLLEAGAAELGKTPKFVYTEPPLAPKTSISPTTGKIEYKQIPRKTGKKAPTYNEFVQQGRSAPGKTEKTPLIHLRSQKANEWKFDEKLTSLLMEVLTEGSTTGLSFAGKTILITGAGPGSIGAEIVRGLLCAGALVIATTSSDTTKASKFYQKMYKTYGARGSSLTVLPYNAGSKKDTEALVDHIYSDISSFGDGIDYVIPFASIPELGRSLDGLDGRSELAHRAMLINVMRLLGSIKKHKEKTHLITRPTNAILPLSPNHGTFGGDGLYGESKIGLETLLNRWHSEDWAEYLTICGAVIGWTRGTGLMEGNDNAADAIESNEANAVTFSNKEMAFNIISLMDPRVNILCEDGPLYADLTGGMGDIIDLKDVVSNARQRLLDESALLKALRDERSRQDEVLNLNQINGAPKARIMTSEKKRGTPSLRFPTIPAERPAVNVADLRGLVDLSRTVVVVGFSELSPWGSARTRWEYESQETFSLEGWVEMAWMMGLVKHITGEVDGKPYAGWVDAKTKEPVEDQDISKQYGDTILNHSGLRFVESESLNGYDPERKEFLHEVVIDEDLPPFEASKAEAEAFKLRHGDKATIIAIPDSENFTVHLKKGAPFLVAKATPFDRRVAGQLPKGWDPESYGIPKDIVAQVDPITIYALCCMSEALLSAGIRDPFEFYEHMHISEIANCLGSGAGALLAVRSMYKDRYLDKDVKGDVLQESYLNCLGAWTNMLLLGSAGPIRSPTGTCATAIESLDTGCEAIQTGKVKVAFVGGSDDFQEESSYEFSKMEATASSDEHIQAGRPPSEISRPMTTTRHGFVESEGCGVQIIMNAEVAIQMGLPIYAVVAHTSMAGDTIGRSVPAPGQGIMTTAKESPEGRASPVLDLEYRRANVVEEIAHIEAWRKRKVDMLSKSHPQVEQQRLAINSTAECKIRDAQNLWSYELRKQNPGISPIRAALAVWGLGLDDIQVSSLHGTSTKANDKNESNVINTMMEHLGRSHGNPLIAISQKYLTGHTKGASGALMFNGGIQVLGSGTIPGNRNADNIEPELKKFPHLVYPSATIQTPGIKAFMLTSFGFGQKGGIAIALAPKYLYSAIADSTYAEYRTNALQRQKDADMDYLERLISNTIFKAKTKSAWADLGTNPVFLNPEARVLKDRYGEFSYDAAKIRGNDKTKKPDSGVVLSAKTSQDVTASLESASMDWLNTQISQDNRVSTGVDVEVIADVPWTNETFVERNFTEAEREYCSQAPDPAASYAGRWTAKEAVFKSLQIPSLGAGASMNEISIEADEGGVPRVNIMGKLGEIARSKGIRKIDITITHARDTVMAIALATRERRGSWVGAL